MLRSSDYARLIQGRNFIIATDFDGTLVESGKYPNFGEPTKWFKFLKFLRSNFKNVQIILYTCREGKELSSAVDFCACNGLMFDAVNEDVLSTLKWKDKSRKPFAHIYVDDRALSVEFAENLWVKVKKDLDIR